MFVLLNVELVSCYFYLFIFLVGTDDVFICGFVLLLFVFLYFLIIYLLGKL